MEYFQPSSVALTRLREEAKKWIGTPWLPNSNERGKGVACHNLPRSIYIGCGALTEAFPKMTGDPNQYRRAKVSPMVEFLNSRPEFQAIQLDRIQAGDLIGIRLCSPVVSHLGLVLDEHYFIHSLMHKHVSTDLYRVTPWFDRIEAAWRPLTKG